MVGIIRRKPMLTHASIVCGGKLASVNSVNLVKLIYAELEMWANAQRDGRPAEYRWRRLFNAAKFG